jgi:surface polysaccharide O-acyltransferase-like enzyme
MKISVKEKKFSEKFTEWVFQLPGFLAIFFLPAVMIIYIVAVIINKVKGDFRNGNT